METIGTILALLANRTADLSTATIKTIPAEQLIAALVSGTALESKVRTLAQAVEVLTSTCPDATATTLSIDALLGSSGALEPPLIQRAAHLRATFDQLRGIQWLLATPAVDQLVLRLRDPDVFDWLLQWELPAAANQAAWSLVGTLRYGPPQQKVRMQRTQFITRKTTLHYCEGLAFPLVNLALPSSDAIGGLRSERVQWLQGASEQYDLTLYNAMLAPAGTISTRWVNLPIVVAESRIQIVIDLPAPLRALATELRDSSGVLVATSIRLCDPTDMTNKA